MFTRFALAAATIAAFAAARPAAAQSYNFDMGGAAFTNTAGSITTQSGLTVDFTSSQDANGGFYIGANNGLFSGLGGTLLIDPGVGGDSLTLTFSSAITSLSFNFGVIDLLSAPGTPADALSFLDSNNVSGTANTSILGNSDLFPQGNAVFTDAAGFTSVTISDAQAFVIGVSNVPEPASLLAFGAGLMGLAALLRRARRAA